MEALILKELYSFIESCCGKEPVIRLAGELEVFSWHTATEPHVHQAWELKIDQAGSDIILVPPSAPHSSSSCYAGFQVSSTEFEIVFGEQVPVYRLSRKLCSVNILPELFAALQRLAEAGEAADMPSRSALSAAILQNLLLIIRLLKDEKVRGSGEVPDLFELGLEYIRRNYYRSSLSVEDVAQFVGVTPQYLNQLFRKRVKHGIRQSLVEVRLTRARELLEERTYLIGEVARLTGWNSPFYFCTCFRQFYGFPPRQLLK